MKYFTFALLLLLIGQSTVSAQPIDVSQQFSTPQYSREVNLLSKPAEISHNKGKKGPDDAQTYHLKKLEYGRSLDNYIKTQKEDLGAEGVSISVISKDDLLFMKGYGNPGNYFGNRTDTKQ